MLQVFACFFCVPFAGKAQQTIDLTPFQVSEGWYVINGGIYISPDDFLHSYKQVWNLGNQDDLQLVKVETDELGYTRYRYQQRYNTRKVEQTDFFLHYKDSLLVEANAIVVPNLMLNTSAQISEATALQNVMAYLNASEYAWQNPNMEMELRELTEDSTATYYPQGELLLAKLKGRDLEAGNIRLAYKFDIIATIPYKHTIVYVDAITGEVFQDYIIAEGDRLDGRGDRTEKGFTNKCDVTGSCITLYNGYQNITVIRRIFGLTDHILRECDRKIRTTKGGDNWSMWDVKDNDGNWETNEQWSTSAHWATEKSYDYFKHAFGRIGINNNGRKISVDAVNLPNYRSFYKYDDYNKHDELRIGRHTYPYPTVGQSSAFPPSWNTGISHASLDKVGHLYGLGVVCATANLNKENLESGALLVSFGDIFGTMIERFAQGGMFDWTIGEDTGITERNMENPLALQHPNIYKGSFWVYQPNTYGGLLTIEQAWEEAIKKNAGVQNRWFYLLSVGGNGVQGIGIDKAASIAYRSLTTKLSQNSTYAQARAGAIQAAIELFGVCSVEVAQVKNAWHAVGVGAANDNICFNLLGGGGLICKGYFHRTYTVQSNENIVVQWNYPPSLSASISGDYNRVLTLTGNTLYFPNFLEVTATVGTKSSKAITNLKSCVGPRLEGRAPIQQIGDEKEISLYPNPTKGETVIDLGTEVEENATVQVLNTQGVHVSSFVLRQQINTLDLSALPAGLYFLHISNGNKRTVRKIQIIK